MKLGACWVPAVLLAACGTVDSGSGQDLSIRAAALPDAVVGRDYQEKNVVLQVERGSGSLSWSLPQLPPSLAWLSVGESTGRLAGTPLGVVSPAAPFVVQVTNGTATTRQPFSLSVGCQEGATSACGVPDAALAMCVAGSRVCLNGALGSCTVDVGKPPYEADASHCGAACDETCSRITTNRCVGTCTCGDVGAPCSGAAPVCCQGVDGRPESFVCVSLQSPEHCGACQTACQPRTNTGVGCAASACTFPCNTPWLNCNGGPVTSEGADADGCETRVDNDVNHCGACGRRCPVTLPASAHVAPGALPSCAAGHCRYPCDLRRYHDCSSGTCLDFTTDQDVDGCETDFSSPGSCGGPGNVCPDIENADPICTLNGGTGRYECGLRCRSGFDPDPCGAPPVCKPLSDPENCGVCGRACPPIDTEDGNQRCSASGQCCTTVCDPAKRPPCGPEVCR
jgi:hypothetical protein